MIDYIIWQREKIVVDRSYLWIAGQTAPPRVGNVGGGFEFWSKLIFHGQGIVVDHMLLGSQIGGNTYAFSLSDGLTHTYMDSEEWYTIAWVPTSKILFQPLVISHFRHYRLPPRAA